jgi:hypothetical protein
MKQPISVVKEDFFCVGSENIHTIVIKHIMDSPKIMFFWCVFWGEGRVNGIATSHSLTP